MNEFILTLENIEKTYVSSGETLTIIKNLSLNVERGKKCVIVGKSGSGKSTLLNIIGGLDNATSGNVFVNGQNVGLMNERQKNDFRKNVLGLVFQFHYLLKDFTAVENIFLPAYMAGVPKKQAMEKALQLLEDIGLSDRKDHLPSELSGGERQRVAVARSLVNNPELILADEPTGNLDPENSVLIGDMLFSLSEKYGKTLVLVTHDMNLASKGDVVYSIEKGSLVEKK
ncbi:MAG: ABC transporter ATP-binding protein [Treponema sp.]|nr:ABC transporter ATP-binding protein [Spirochaetia bacterium]MDD7459668.1 ABC transporter ATP-binding protein [Spirochaetales bacterium]MDY5811660.1 ABC transporter ATP-binding protein [Treponema sp.]